MSSSADGIWILDVPNSRTNRSRSSRSVYAEVLRWVAQDRTWSGLVAGSSEVIRAEVLHAVVKEMALKLTDVTFRRTDLATLGHPGEACLQDVAAIIAAGLGWDEGRTEQALSEARLQLSRQGVTVALGVERFAGVLA
jgi:glycerol-3-phosphate dehydrogenase